MPSKNISSGNVSSGNILSENISNGKISSENISNGNISIGNIASGSGSSENIQISHQCARWKENNILRGGCKSDRIRCEIH